VRRFLFVSSRGCEGGALMEVEEKDMGERVFWTIAIPATVGALSCGIFLFVLIIILKLS